MIKIYNLTKIVGFYQSRNMGLKMNGFTVQLSHKRKINSSVTNSNSNHYQKISNKNLRKYDG